MRQPRKILACVDQSDYATHVADYAAWAATRLSSPLELLHVIDRHQEVASEIDRSGSIGMDAQENLLERLSQEEGERSRAARDHWGWLVAVLSPPVLFERFYQALAETDMRAQLDYEANVRRFHRDLRQFYYPRLFLDEPFDSEQAVSVPVFEP